MSLNSTDNIGWTVLQAIKNRVTLSISSQETVNTAFIFSLCILTTLIFYFAMVKQYVPLDKFSNIRLLILLLFSPIIVKFVIYLIMAPWYQLVEAFRSQKRVAYMPSVSVLIPAWNEEVGIKQTIQSVIETQYTHLEIIVINDGSTDLTHETVLGFINEHNNGHYSKIPIKYRKVTNGGKARALNMALSMAVGELIVTIDADSVMDKNAIKNLVKHFNNPKVASVAGNVVIGNRSKPTGIIQQLEYLYGFYFKRADSLMNAVYIVGGAAASYRRKIIMDMGGFDETIITEDIELSTRLQDKGYYVRYAADAIVYTEGPSDFKGLCNQRLRWKFGRLLTFYKYRHLFFSFKKKHNFFLSFLVLPIALFAEVLLFFEGILLAAFYAYTFYTNDFIPLACVILILTSVIAVQIVSDPQRRYHKNLLLIAPGAWIIFYIMDVVEYQALIKCIWKMIRRQDPVWQSWSRVGVFDSASKVGYQ